MRRTLTALVTGPVLLLGLLGAVLITGTTPASAAPQQCVGLIVDFGGGTVDSSCVPYKPGLTGAQVLATGHQVTNKGGFACRIDGHPQACKSDNTHYWAYYHRAAGKTTWAYSQKGAAQYKVHPGETEGWAWINGSARKPKSVPYARLAASASKPTASHSSASQPSASSPSASASASASPRATDAATSSSGSGGGTPWGVIVGIIVIVAILAAAGWRWRAGRSH